MNKQERLQKRRNNLMPNGVPKWIRIYDNPKFTDRYQVVFSNARCFGMKGRVPILGMSGNPYHPQGYCIHDDMPLYGKDSLVEGNKAGDWPPAIGKKGNLGIRIKFEDLPEDCKKVVIDDYMDYWNLKE